METQFKTPVLLKAKFDPERPTTLKEHAACNPNGPGLLINGELGPITANLGFIGKITTRMLSGSLNLAHLRVPTVLCHTEPYLHIWSYSFLNLPKYIKLACKTTDPMERLKLITAGFISDLHDGVLLAGGQPPVMSFPGQCLSGTNEFGATFNMNMLSCKPDKIQAEIEITDHAKDFTLVVNQNYMVEINGFTINSLKVTDSSIYKIALKDGTKYTITLPRVKVYDTLTSTRKFVWKNKNKNGKIKFDELQFAAVSDKTNNLKCTMDFGKKPEKGNGFWAGVFGNEKIWDVYNKN
jgi:hypothetical protein